jgi:D-proline reductase (dithiol) PrdB
MASLTDLPLKYRLFAGTYRWRRIEPVPFTRLEKPLGEARVGLVSTAGLVPPGEPPFDETVKGGDTSYRTIPSGTDLAALVESHRSDAWDHRGVTADRNLALPIERLEELREAGRIGAVNRRHLSFMGSVTAPGRLVRDSAPEAAQLFVDDQVDVALLVPV